MPELKPGDLFAGHRIEELAGRGGMGVVYRAVQLDLERRVALKLIAPQLAEDPDFRERFVRESRAAASIDHPNVIPIYYTGEHDGALYIAMRYVEGSDLRTLVRAGGPLPPAGAASVVAQVGGALDAAHERGIVHRDVKPANVLLGAGEHAYLTDFGLTKRLTSQTGTTRAGGWVGTLGFVAPEQVRGERVDARTDVYALGCVLFHALTGRPPYQRDGDEATLWAHLHDPPPSTRTLAPAVSEELDAAIRRALAKDPDERFPSAGDLGRAALAAVGRAPAPGPERVVARGDAAPDEGEGETAASPDQALTLPGIAPAAPGAGMAAAAGAAAAPSAPASATAAEPRRPRVPAWPWALAAVPVAALAVVVALVLTGDDGAQPGRTAATETNAPAAAPAGSEPPGRVAATVQVGGVPNDVALAEDRAYVLRASSDRLAVIDTVTAKRLDVRPPVGPLPASASPGFGRLWVGRQGLPALVAVDLRTGRRSGREVPLPSEGKVVAVAAGGSAVWVGIRGTPGRVVRVDPRARRVTKEIQLPTGVQDLAVGEGAVWVTARRADVVTRIDVETGDLAPVPVGRSPAGVAVGEGAVWVTNSDDDTVTRVDPGSLGTETIGVGDRPYGIAAGDGAVWVANRNSSTLSRIDPARRRVVGVPVEVDANPFSVAIAGEQVWVTSPPRRTVQRVDFR